MAIEFNTRVEGGVLFVTTTGFDESLQQVQDYGMAIIAASQQAGVAHVLCNELGLEYRLSVTDTFRAAEFIAANAPKVSKVAIVANPKYITDVRFWETVAVNRGLTVRAFQDVGSAEKWLRA